LSNIQRSLVFAKIFNRDYIKYIWSNSSEYHILSIQDFYFLIKENFPNFNDYYKLKEVIEFSKIAYIDSSGKLIELGDPFSISELDKEFQIDPIRNLYSL